MLSKKFNITFDYWDEETFPTSVDRLFSDSLVFNTYQEALKSTLELMGTRLAPIPVVLPITSSPDTISAVLRSGAQPLLVDVDLVTLQMDPNQLRDALDAAGTAIGLLTLPGGQAPAQELLKLLDGLPVVADTRLVPRTEPVSYGNFTVYDLAPICGAGGLIHHTFEKQQADLKIIRSGLLGHAANMSGPQMMYLEKRVEDIDRIKQAQKDCASLYSQELQRRNKGGMIVFEESTDWPYYLVRVPNASRVVAHLNSEGVDAKLAFYPLHRIPELKARWKEEPNYPAADSLSDTIVALPTSVTLISDPDTCKAIIDTLLEVV